MKIKGFIDIHTHGINRYDTKTTNPEHILKMAELHGRAGTAAILPTIYSAPIDEMRKNMEAVRRAIRTQSTEHRIKNIPILHALRITHYASQILGVHLEGPFLNPPLPPFAKGGRGGINHSSLITRHSSLILGVHLEGPFLNPVRCGALDKDSFIKPTISSLKNLIEGYEDIIKIITIAPEIPGALKIIERCNEHGIRVNMGHSDSTYKQALDAKKAGATGITHLFNAMRPFHHREPGLIGLGLMDEDIYIEVIADKVHINETVLKLIFTTKRSDRVILISDSVKGAKIKKGHIYPKSGVLAGSLITLSDTVKNLKNLGIPETIVKKASIDNPRRYLNVK